MRKKESELPYGLDLLDERATAFHDCICFMRQAYPNFGVTTYDRNVARGAEQVVLAKFVTGIGDNAPVYSLYENTLDATTADNVPGGLFSRTVLEDGRRYEVELYPMLVGRDEAAFEKPVQKHLGGAAIHIANHTGEAFWLRFGGEGLAFMHFSPNEAFRGPDISCAGNTAEIKDDHTVILRRGGDNIITAVRGDFVQAEIFENNYENAGKGRGTYAVCKLTGENIYVTVGFAESEEDAYTVSTRDASEEIRKAIDHYKKLAGKAVLNTPEPELNEAFTHALYNVEYSWLRPYGWIESFHHWPTMWHMEHTAHEEWLGNFERVRDCLRSQMKNVFESGAIPDMCPTGGGRRDWGGNNQFFLREVEHYVKMTGDIDFAREAEPFMERALRQSMLEYDPTGSGVFSWYRQIGNQEDMESTPGKGAATGIEGVRMFEILAWLKRLLGKDEEAEKYELTAKAALKAWRECIWDKGLGREIWYEDILGEKHLDTTYHGICYPIIYGYLDDIDALTSLDHLKSRLTGPEGEVYQSNHFGDHCIQGVPTWGMQAGSDMQPFATMAYARMGKAEDAVNPLRFVARRVCGDFQRGSWPETANEKRFAYFSPSAAMYTQGVVEGLFGLRRDKLRNRTEIAPCLPEDWPEAELTLPGTHIKVERSGRSITLRAEICDDTEKIVAFVLPEAIIDSVIADGARAHYGIRRRAGFTQVFVMAGAVRSFNVTVGFTPIKASVICGNIISQGDILSIRTEGAEIAGLIDREGIFDEITAGSGGTECVLKKDLLDPYLKFGPLGTMNFARRSFFVKLRVKQGDDGGYIELLRGVDLTILPRLSVSAELHRTEGGCECGDCVLNVTVKNHSSRAIFGPWRVKAGGEVLKGTETVKAIAPGAKLSISFPISAGTLQKLRLTPGRNNIKIYCGDTCIDADLEAGKEFASGKYYEKALPIALPEELIKPMFYWRKLGNSYARGCIVMDPDSFLKGFDGETIELPLLEGIPLRTDRRGFVPFGREKHPVVTVPLEGRRIRKLYLVISAFIENHDMFSRILRIEAEAVKKDSMLRPVITCDLRFPGDLDMGFGNTVIANFSSFRNGLDRSREILFPEAGGNISDFSEAHPPLFPQPEFWCRNRAFEAGNTVFNLIEIDLGEEREMKEFRLAALNADACGGLFAAAYV
ncbi:MAG: hypothetical protein J5950_08930 [Clostridia bacterium]|nr:hypothetical protein [Clostridia bacterium]